MDKTTYSLILLFLFTLLNYNCIKAQSTKLIVRGDDMGFSHSSNEAIIDSYQKGIMTTVEVMPVTPWFPEVIQMCNANPDLDVGIHLSLTSEWTNVKWRPLTQVESLIDSNGYFYPMVWPNSKYGEDQALANNGWTYSDIEKEIRAQIELGIKNIPHISHVTAHMGWYSLDEKVASLLKRLAVEYKIDIDPIDYNVTKIRLTGPRKTPGQKVDSFLKMLLGLEKGKTYLFVEHPAYNTNEMKAIGHIGYKNVAEDRNGVTTMWTHPKVIAEVKRLNIELINYKDIKEH